MYFSTEMWERYGFYVVQTLLALYLAIHFQLGDKRIYSLVGSFTALTYLSPMIGGWIADHLLGQKRCILVGTAVLFFSYLALGFLKSAHDLTLSLAGIAVGTGLLKPNIASLLGNEYPVGSPSRERGFTIFYMGITTGIILGTTLPSYIQSIFGWPASFLSATIGIIIAILVFSYGIHHHRIKDYSPYQHKFENIIYAILLIISAWYGAYYILHNPTLANVLFIVIGLLSLGYLIYTFMCETRKQACQTMVIGLLCLISIMFWTFYFQMFLSLTLCLDRIAKPTLFGMPFPPSYYVTVQSFGMIIFGFLLVQNKKKSTLSQPFPLPSTIEQARAICRRAVANTHKTILALSKHIPVPRRFATALRQIALAYTKFLQQEHLTLSQHTIRVGQKFLLAMFFMVAAYTLIPLVAYFSHGTILLSPLYFIPAYLMISIAELLLSPVGLSAITLLSNHKKVSTMMGIFFVSLGLGGFLSGKLATITAISQYEARNLSIKALKAHYALTFSYLLCILLAATLICIFINRIIKYLMTSGYSDPR